MIIGNMRFFCSICFVFILLISNLIAEEYSERQKASAISINQDFFSSNAEGVEAPKDGQALLNACVERMPLEPLEMVGRITMRRRYGIEIKEFDFCVTTSLGADEPFSLYEIKDTSGKLLESVSIKRNKDGEHTILRTLGEERQKADPPNLTDSIQGSDVTWLDVSMDFVWWGEPELCGTEKIKGRLCDILRVKPLKGMQDCASVKLWVDRGQNMVLQAMQESANGTPLRKMWVRAVQKIDNQWVLRDIEVETTGASHRTKIHFDDVKRLSISAK